MKKRCFGLIILVLLLQVSTAIAQQPRGRSPQRPAQPDLKIRYKTTTAGQASESVTMIKGARERREMRMGYGMDTVNITQCDLKQTIQLSENTRKYLVTPMENQDSTVAPANTARTNQTSEPSRRGGVLNYITRATDTGERKEMFGFTARHVKTSVTMQSSPDACSPVNQRMETDGWYIDLSFGLECDLERAQMVAPAPAVSGGCRDRVVARHEGTARKGYPLIETVTMYSADGKVVFTSTKEVLELSREPLDAALFDVPAGYTETANSQELYSMPSTESMMAQAANAESREEEGDDRETTGSSASRQPGTVRVGVVTINNQSDRSVSLAALRERLIAEIKSSGIDAVGLNALSRIEAETEAQNKQCDYILFTDISSLKMSAAKKLGGLLGRAAGVSGIEKAEARVVYRLFEVGKTAPRLKSSATAKEEGGEASVGTALDAEARAVVNEVRKQRQ